MMSLDCGNDCDNANYDNPNMIMMLIIKIIKLFWLCCRVTTAYSDYNGDN